MVSQPTTPPAGDTTPTVVGPPAPVTTSLRWQWTGWDGADYRTWDLTDLASPVLKVRGATGTGHAVPEHHWTDAPLLDGSSWDGVRFSRGQLTVPVIVTGSDTASFLAEHAAFLRSLDARREGTMRITRPDGQWREFTCRYDSGADMPIDLDPAMACRASYVITWNLADPFPAGEPVVLRFTNPAPTQLFPGPPFHINSSRTLASASFTNPGDVASPPLWRISGPFTGFRVGLGDAVVALTLTKPAGGWVEIDMAARQRTILDEAGVDRWLAATEAEFADIPPGVDVPLTVQVDGATADTSVELSFTPKYQSAWT